MDAIRTLHLLIDDDHNGNVDQSESDEFLRDELQYTDGFERQALFHNNDKLISVDDLWKAWKHSLVYNWTVEDVIDWLVTDVDLPQYSHNFHSNSIDGSFLPRLVNSSSPLLALLGIRNPVHKQKLSLKAMDTVLFGAPKRIHSYAKDLLLVSSCIIAIGGCWFACLHHRYSQTQVKKMMKDLESLQKAEDALKKLSRELAEAEKNQKSVPPEKQEEMRILRQTSLRLKVPSPRLGKGDVSPNSLSREGSVVRRQEGEQKLKQAEQELASLREALEEAENKLELQQHLESQWTVPGELQAWLQLTYELEQVHYNAKRQAAERQLGAARDGCDKIKKRNKAFFGSLRMAHSNSLDEIDQSILDARAALEEVKQDLQERLHRWHTVELLCDFSIITNPGLAVLKQTLGRENGSNRGVPGNLLAPVSIDEADEDLPPAEEQVDPTLYSKISESQRQQIFAWYNRSRRLNRGRNDDQQEVDKKITEKQRQQIIAWYKRSRLNRRLKNANGYPSLQSTSSSKSFLKQSGYTGSSSSLSLTNKSPSSHPLRRDTLDTPDSAGSSHAKSYHAGPGVAFHLGDVNSHHERTPSNVSSVKSQEQSSPQSQPQPHLSHIPKSSSFGSGASRASFPANHLPSPSSSDNHSAAVQDETANHSFDSLSRNQSMPRLSRPRLDRSAELDLNSLDSESVYSATGFNSTGISLDSPQSHTRPVKDKKNSKKKKLLPSFLKKSSKPKS